MKPKNVSLYCVTLLNGEEVIVKNNTGEKVERLKSKEYIRDYRAFERIARKEMRDFDVKYDLDKIRSLRAMHKLLVKDIYMSQGLIG